MEGHGRTEHLLLQAYRSKEHALPDSPKVRPVESPTPRSPPQGQADRSAVLRGAEVVEGQPVEEEGRRAEVQVGEALAEAEAVGVRPPQVARAVLPAEGEVGHPHWGEPHTEVPPSQKCGAEAQPKRAEPREAQEAQLQVVPPSIPHQGPRLEQTMMWPWLEPQVPSLKQPPNQGQRSSRSGMWGCRWMQEVQAGCEVLRWGQEEPKGLPRNLPTH